MADGEKIQVVSLDGFDKEILLPENYAFIQAKEIGASCACYQAVTITEKIMLLALLACLSVDKHLAD